MSPTSRRLLLGLRLLALLLVLTFLLAPRLSEANAWGLWPATYLPTVWRWALALLAAGLALFGDRLPMPHVGWPQARLALALLAAVPFYLLRVGHTRWGDAYILVNSIPHPEVHLTYSWQAPLDVYLHAKVWAAGHALFGWVDAMPAYWLLSTAAGVAFVWVLLGLAVWLGRDTAERVLIVGLVGTLGVMQLFFGYIENYTFMTLGVLIYAWLALRTLRGQTALYWPALALALTNGFHPATIVLTPSLLYVWLANARGQGVHEPDAPASRWPAGVRYWAVSFLPVALPYVLVGIGVLGMMTAGGHGLNAFLSGDAPGGGDHRFFVPLFGTATRWEHYTMFSLGHLADVINEQLLTAPAILPAIALSVVLAWPCVKAGWTGGGGAGGRFDARAMRFLTIMSAFYLLLIWTWNPDYGGQRDWDLFAPAAVPAALLLAFLLPRALPERPALRAAGWALISAQALHTAAWIYQNTRPWSWT